MRTFVPMNKKPVSVIYRTDEDGRVRPMSIIVDEAYYPIDALLATDRAKFIQRGLHGTRYKIRIASTEYYLWCEPDGSRERWMLEKIQP